MIFSESFNNLMSLSYWWGWWILVEIFEEQYFLKTTIHFARFLPSIFITLHLLQQRISTYLILCLILNPWINEGGYSPCHIHTNLMHICYYLISNAFEYISLSLSAMNPSVFCRYRQIWAFKSKCTENVSSISNMDWWYICFNVHLKVFEISNW